MFLLTALCAACAGPLSLSPTIPVEKRAEERELPPPPEAEKVPDEIPKDDWVVPLEAGSCTSAETGLCPSRSGILVSEFNAYVSALYRIRYKELRETFMADRVVWSAHREMYEERLKLADRAIQDLQPNWWDRNKLSIGAAGGALLGVAATIAILAVTDEAR